MVDTYYVYHIGMHNPENNLRDDESSTMAYRRDSLKSFLSYLSKFIVGGLYDFAFYFKKRNRKKLMYSAMRGEILLIVVSSVLCCFNWPTTFCVLIFPYFFYRLIAMLGNWAQHAFIDPDDPTGRIYCNEYVQYLSLCKWDFQIKPLLSCKMDITELCANPSLTW